MALEHRHIAFTEIGGVLEVAAWLGGASAGGAEPAPVATLGQGTSLPSCPLLCSLGCGRILFVSALCQAGQLHLPLLAAPLHLQCG